MNKKNGSTRIHHGRDDLTGEHLLSDAGQVVFAVLFAAVWIADSFFFNYTTFLNEYVPYFVRVPVGALVIIASWYLAYKGHSIVFGEKREKPEIIRKNVFGVIRHPLYLSEVLLYFGFFMFSVSLAAAVIWIFAGTFLYYMSRHEEKLLLERFGEEYEQYMKDVPMWIPRMGKK